MSMSILKITQKKSDYCITTTSQNALTNNQLKRKSMDENIKARLEAIDEVRKNLGLYPYEQKMNPWVKFGVAAGALVGFLWIISNH